MGMKRSFVAAVAASLMIALLPTGAPASGALMLVEVRVGSRAEARYLLENFDETHNHRDGVVELLLWPGDLAELVAAGFEPKVLVADVVARDAALLGATGPVVSLPGPDRDTYRVLEDYEGEMKALAEEHPDLVRLVKLPHKTLEGRRVLGVEIAARVGRRHDGRPYFHVDGVHHAREWPSGEYPMIFAHHLVEGFGSDPRITKLLREVRIQIVPVVNVDGFDYARDSLIDPPGATSLPLAVIGAEAYWRKNRRSFTGTTVPEAQRNPDAYGVDVNRNYAFKWGDDEGGSSGEHVDQTYRGEAPFSEPEAANIRSLVLSRQVTAMITNHTSGRLVLRPWGHTAADAPDEDLLRRLGSRLAEAMGGYTNQKGIGLYATTGTTDDWAYSATSALGYTFEHETAFHPPYADSVGANHPGVLEAFMIAAEAAADPDNHAVVRGRLVGEDGRPVRGPIRLHKSFRTPLWPGNPTGEKGIAERLTSKLEVGRDGRFEWHLNPSTRPTVVERGGREGYRLTFTSRLGFASRRLYLERGQTLNLGDVTLEDADGVLEVIIVVPSDPPL